MHSDANENTQPAVAARRRADDARRRAVAAREAAEQATTEYARLAHHRVADLHTELAVDHEDLARALGAGDDVAPGE
jgi:hypothetical protein